MHPDVMVAFRNLKELPPDDAIMHLPETEPPEAPPAGVHYVGDRVKVGARVATWRKAARAP